MRTLILGFVFCCITRSASAQCTPVITPVGNTTFCQGGSVTLIGSFGDTYQWYLNGSPIAGASTDTFIANTAGSYTVEIDSAGCINMSPAEVVTVNTVPAQPGPISGPSTTCHSSTATYTITPVVGATGYLWDNIMSDTTLIPSVTAKVWPSAGPTVIRVHAINVCGHSSSTSKSVTVTGLPWIHGHYPGERDVADRGARICPGNPYVLFAYAQASMDAMNTSPYTYQWCLDGVPIPGQTDYEFTITRGGNYSAQLITQDCGILVLPKKVYQDVPNSITISPAGPLSFCVGNATPLTVSFDLTGVSDPIKWNWFKGGYSNQGSANAYSILPDISGYYNVMSSWVYSPYSNCTISSNYVSFTIPPPLEVTQINDTLYATPGYASYQWYESGSPVVGATSQSHVLTFDGIYSVEAIFGNGCIELSDTFDSDFLLPPPGDENGNQEEIEELSIAPNPVTGFFNLVAKVPAEDKTAAICITDVTGQVIFQKTVEVKDGIVEETINMPEGMTTFSILKLRSKGSNQTMPLLKK